LLLKTAGLFLLKSASIISLFGVKLPDFSKISGFESCAKQVAEIIKIVSIVSALIIKICFREFTIVFPF
jgi:hypothetical protein